MRSKGLPFKFRGRSGDTYYWARELLHSPGYEEVVSCNVRWFWSGGAA